MRRNHQPTSIHVFIFILRSTPRLKTKLWSWAETWNFEPHCFTNGWSSFEKLSVASSNACSHDYEYAGKNKNLKAARWSVGKRNPGITQSSSHPSWLRTPNLSTSSICIYIYIYTYIYIYIVSGLERSKAQVSWIRCTRRPVCRSSGFPRCLIKTWRWNTDLWATKNLSDVAYVQGFPTKDSFDFFWYHFYQSTNVASVHQSLPAFRKRVVQDPGAQTD